MFVLGDFGDNSPAWFWKILKLPSFYPGNSKIFKNTLGQFIPNPKIILAIPKQSLLLGCYTTVNHVARYVEIWAFYDPYFTVYG